MIRVAHIDKNKVISISVWDKEPNVKNLLVIPEKLDVHIGDKLVDGKLVNHVESIIEKDKK